MRNWTRNGFASSIGLHLFLLLILAVMVARQNADRALDTAWQDPNWQSRPIEIQLLTPPASLPQNRVVETTAGQKSKTAAPDAYLSDQTRRVEVETLAKMGKKGAKAQSAPQPNAVAQTAPPKAQRDIPKVIPIAKLGVPLPSAAAKPQAEASPQGPQWVRADGDLGNDSREYIKGLKESEITALNTKEYIYFTYFKRIRDQLEQAWRPILKAQVVKIYKMGRQIASDLDLTTSTVVTLDTKGDVVRVQVVSESGTQDLDDAAVRAFNRAGPFPNPPKGLVDAQGIVQIRWDFVLKT